MIPSSSLFFLLISLFSPIFCGIFENEFEGNLLGMAINEVEGEEYEHAVELAKQAGVKVASLSLFWDEMEEDPGDFDQGWLPLIDYYYPAMGLAISLELPVIDTVSKRQPPDLLPLPFDSPIVISRFNSFLHFLSKNLKRSQIVALSIGNEIDGVLGQDPDKWGPFINFFQNVSTTAREFFPRTPIGTKVMAKGAIALHQSYPSILSALYSYSDGAFYTYYPIAPDFRPLNPSTLDATMDTLLSLSSLPVYMMEIGYPSSEICGGSEKSQKDFIVRFMSYWKRNEKRIPLVMIDWLTDQPSYIVTDWSNYYGSKNRCFIEFLSSLGLRREDGVSKSALEALIYAQNSG